jgi:hypothetical protein
MDGPGRAANAIRVKAPRLGAAAVAALYRLRPELETRYGETGRRHCQKDLGHHLRFLAAAVEMRDAKVFSDYAVWAAGVMVAHGVDVGDTMASFQALEGVPAAVPPESAALVHGIINAALSRLDVWRPSALALRSRYRRSPASPQAAPTGPAPPSTAGPAPARS